MQRDKRTHIHCWDRALFLRALAWAVAIEAVAIGLAALGYDGSTGPPHSFPNNPLPVLFLLFHLPSILIAGLLGLNFVFVIVLQTALITYVLFVWFRLKKIKITLR